MLSRDCNMTFWWLLILSASRKTIKPYWCLESLNSLNTSNYDEFYLHCRDFDFPAHSWTRFFKFHYGPFRKIEIKVLEKFPKSRMEVAKFMKHLQLHLLFDFNLTSTSWQSAKIEFKNKITGKKTGVISTKRYSKQEIQKFLEIIPSFGPWFYYVDHETWPQIDFSLYTGNRSNMVVEFLQENPLFVITVYRKSDVLENFSRLWKSQFFFRLPTNQGYINSDLCNFFWSKTSGFITGSKVMELFYKNNCRFLRLKTPVKLFEITNLENDVSRYSADIDTHVHIRQYFLNRLKQYNEEEKDVAIFGNCSGIFKNYIAKQYSCQGVYLLKIDPSKEFLHNLSPLNLAFVNNLIYPKIPDVLENRIPKFEISNSIPE